MANRMKAVLGCVLLVGAVGLSACAPPATTSKSPESTTTSSVEASADSSAATSSATTTATAPPTQAEVIEEAKKQVVDNKNGVKVASVTDVKIAQDLKGRWWASAQMVPDDQKNYDIATICLVKEEGRWAMVDFGVGLESPAIPAEVLDKLK